MGIQVVALQVWPGCEDKARSWALAGNHCVGAAVGMRVAALVLV